MLRLRHIIFLFFSIICAWIGWSMYVYFFDTTQPIIILKGIIPNEAYAGDIQCKLLVNKKAEVALWLDDVLLTGKYHISSNDEHPFIIPTKTVANGPHIFKIEVSDNSFTKNKNSTDYTFIVDNQPLQASLISPDDVYKVFQGRTMHVQLQTNKPIKTATISLLSGKYECFPEAQNSLVYEAFIPTQCEEIPNEYLMHIEVVDKVGNKVELDQKIQIILFPFKKHTLHISEEKIKEEEAMTENSQDFEDILEQLTNDSPKMKLWKGAFCVPMDIARITCEFGTVRTTQRKGRYAHKAIDAINTPKSVVWAPADGVVIIKDRFTFTGNTIVIDHGLGIISIFGHLENFSKIETGQKIKKGNPIGTMGKTGYASGYHLHWEMRIGNVAIDPMQWTKPNF
jgi:hypothetical protein